MYFLELLNGALLTDLLIMALCLSGVLDGWTFPHFKDSTIAKWYQSFGTGAVLSDVTIIMLGVILAKFLYPFVYYFLNRSFLQLFNLIQYFHV